MAFRLSQRDCQGVWTLADHLAGTDWWDDHILGYQAVTALEWQDHLSSRLKLMASLAKCLLGPRAPEFFRFRSVGCVGQKSLYPFAVLLCPLSAEGRGEVLEQAQRWPQPIAEHVSRASKAATQRFSSPRFLESSRRTKQGTQTANGLRFSCKNRGESTI